MQKQNRIVLYSSIWGFQNYWLPIYYSHCKGLKNRVWDWFKGYLLWFWPGDMTTTSPSLMCHRPQSWHYGMDYSRERCYVKFTSKFIHVPHIIAFSFILTNPQSIESLYTELNSNAYKIMKLQWPGHRDVLVNTSIDIMYHIYNPISIGISSFLFDFYTKMIIRKSMYSTFDGSDKSYQAGNIYK